MTWRWICFRVMVAEILALGRVLEWWRSRRRRSKMKALQRTFVATTMCLFEFYLC